MITVAELTAAIRTTIGTPFHHGGRINGVGLDCGGMILVALASLDIPYYDKPYYNRGDGLNDMIEVLGKNDFNMLESKTPTPGDIILLRNSNLYHHLVYFTEDETIIHAWVTTGVNKVVETTMLPEWWDQIHSIWRYAFLEGV